MIDCAFKNTLSFDLDKQEAGTEVDVKSHQDLREQVFTGLNGTLDRIANGEALPPHELYGDVVLAAATADKVRSIEGRYGPDAQPGRIAGGVKPVRAKDLLDFQEKLHEAISEPDLYAKLKTMDPEQQQQWLANMYRSAGVNSLRGTYMTLYMNAMLSNPYTLGKATAGHFLALPQAVADRFFAEMWSGTNRFSDSTVAPGEAQAMAINFWDNLKDQVSMLGRRDWSGVHQQMVTEGEYHPPLPMTNSPAGALINSVAGAPSAALGAQRAPFRVITRLGELRAQAYRQATADGVAPEKFWQQVEYYQKNPTADMMKAANDFSAENTFTKNMDGLMGDANRTVSSDVGKVLVTPFARVGFNIADKTMQGTPGLSVLSSRFRADMFGPNATATTRAVAMGKLTTGSMVIGTGAFLGMGGVVTGDGPADPSARKLWGLAGWKPNYVYNPITGKPMFSHTALGVFSGWLAMGADAQFLLRHTDAYTAQGIVASAALILAEPVSHAGYVEAFGQIVQGLKEGITSESFWKPVRDRAQQLSLLTPGIVKFATQTFADEGKPAGGVGRGDFYEKEWAALKNSVASDWPGWSEGQPQQRNFLTDEAIPRDGAINHLRGNTATGDPVAKELDRLQTNYGKNKFSVFQPPAYVFGKPTPGLEMYADAAPSVALNPWEKDRVIQLMAGKQPDGEPTLHAALTTMMASPEYQAKEDGPNGGKAMMLHLVYRAYQAGATRRLLEEDPHLAWEVERARREVASKLQDKNGPKASADLPPEPPETQYPRPGQKER
jgi:hypothetical protein